MPSALSEFYNEASNFLVHAPIYASAAVVSVSLLGKTVHEQFLRGGSYAVRFCFCVMLFVCLKCAQDYLKNYSALSVLCGILKDATKYVSLWMCFMCMTVIFNAIGNEEGFENYTEFQLTGLLIVLVFLVRFIALVVGGATLRDERQEKGADMV